MNYDQWKTEEPPDAEDKKCGFCGNPCNDDYCDKECLKADIQENCRD